MADEPDDTEVIRQQMDDSRAALTEKLGLLEEKVTETVQSATASVAETVQSATASVTETVDSVKGAVQGTVDSVRHSVEDTVASVSEALDLALQVKRHPWGMLAGAIAVGYVGAQLLSTGERSRAGSSGRHRTNGSIDRLSLERAAGEGMTSVPSPNHATNGSTTNGSTKGSATTANSGLMSQIGDSFQAEIAKLKGLAVGAAFGMVRDMLTEAGPPSLKHEIAEVIDGFTEKLGGHRISGPVLSKDGNGSATHADVSESLAVQRVF
ncbi:MAG: hypothetical protein AABP62_15215 [Planctomycetota bacterium]